MPFYEVLLRYEDRDELRMTDRPLVVGETLQIAGESWTVTLERDPADIAATAQFLCELTFSQRERARRAQAFDAEMHERLGRLQKRMEDTRRPRPPDAA